MSLGRPSRDIPHPDEREPLTYYVKLKARNEAQAYIEWIDDWLGIQLTPPQEDMIRAVCDNQKTLIVGANGFGKTYCLVAFSLAFCYLNMQSIVVATSGTFGKMQRTYMKPIRELHEKTWGLPGRYLVSSSMIRIDEYPNTYLTATAPRDPGELEGLHSDNLLGIIEEADKPAVKQDHFDSMESLLVDSRDKILVSANPPKDEGDVVNRVMEDDTWETIKFSSFDAHNVQIEMNHDDPYQTNEHGDPVREAGWYKLKPEVEDKMVDGVIRLSQIKNDWESWNQEPWPGIEEAMLSGDREDLDVRWYRRRLGDKPPELAVVHRPYTIDDVEAAFGREAPVVTEVPDGLGFDVARGGGDMNALVGVFGRELRVLDYWDLGKGETHVDSEAKVKSIIHPSWDCRLAVDAVGEGSGVADMIAEWYPNVVRYNNGSNAIQDDKYDNKWTEANAELGKFFKDGGAFRDNRLREQVRMASRSLQYEVSFTKRKGHDFLRCVGKGDLQDRLGQSPDLLDATIMAAWAASDDTYSGPTEIPSTW